MNKAIRAKLLNIFETNPQISVLITTPVLAAGYHNATLRYSIHYTL
jgi:hypothetical protein